MTHRKRYLRNRSTRFWQTVTKKGSQYPKQQKYVAKHHDTKAASSLKYGQKLKIATLHCRGLAALSKRQQLTYIMQQHNIDIMAIQETKQAFSSTESHDGCTFFFPGKQANRGPAHYGVGFVISPQIKHCILDCVPVGDRMMKLTISAKGRKYYIMNLYAPHSGRPNDEKHNFWDLLSRQCEAHDGSTPCFIVGDMNARIHGRQVFEFDIMRHHTFGRGAGYVQEMPGDQLENRQYLLGFCRYNNYITSSQACISQNRRGSSARSSFLRLRVLRRHGHLIDLPNLTTVCAQNAGNMQ